MKYCPPPLTLYTVGTDQSFDGGFGDFALWRQDKGTGLFYKIRVPLFPHQGILCILASWTGKENYSVLFCWSSLRTSSSDTCHGRTGVDGNDLCINLSLMVKASLGQIPPSSIAAKNTRTWNTMSVNETKNSFCFITHTISIFWIFISAIWYLVVFDMLQHGLKK